jgi:hypothetical protein
MTAVGHKQTATTGCFDAPFRSRAEREVNPTSTDAIVGSMKAPVRVAVVDVGECRRDALRSGE